MSSKAVRVGIIASILPHLFCCVLPIVLSVVGLFAPEFAHAHFMPEWLEPWLFVFSAGMLGLSWVMVVVNVGANVTIAMATTVIILRKLFWHV